jgi:hypothetical protein
VRRVAVVAHAGQRLQVIELFEDEKAPEIVELRRSLAWAWIDEMC